MQQVCCDGRDEHQPARLEKVGKGFVLVLSSSGGVRVLHWGQSRFPPHAFDFAPEAYHATSPLPAFVPFPSDGQLELALPGPHFVAMEVLLHLG